MVNLFNKNFPDVDVHIHFYLEYVMCKREHRGVLNAAAKKKKSVSCYIFYACFWCDRQVWSIDQLCVMLPVSVQQHF